MLIKSKISERNLFNRLGDNWVDSNSLFNIILLFSLGKIYSGVITVTFNLSIFSCRFIFSNPIGYKINLVELFVWSWPHLKYFSHVFDPANFIYKCWSENFHLSLETTNLKSSLKPFSFSYRFFVYSKAEDISYLL